MRIERIQTKQGHPVPDSATYAKGPFPPELFQRPEVVVDYEENNGGGETAVGGTAQNNFTPMKYFKCRTCLEIITEREVPSHICEVKEDGESA